MLPLKNIKILDLSRLAAGNMVSHMFADFGADVVKVEKPGKGDDLRNWKINGISHWWAVYSRNKRSISIDLKNKTSVADYMIIASGTSSRHMQFLSEIIPVISSKISFVNPSFNFTFSITAPIEPDSFLILINLNSFLFIRP